MDPYYLQCRPQDGQVPVTGELIREAEIQKSPQT